MESMNLITEIQNLNITNNYDLIKASIESDININICDEYSCTPLMYCIYIKENVNIIEIIKLLIKKTNINHQDYSGETALMLACKFHRIEIVKLLLSAGADVNIRTKKGKSALFEAERNLEILKLLFDYNPDINISMYRLGCQAECFIENIIKAGFDEIINLVLDKGENIKYDEILLYSCIYSNEKLFKSTLNRQILKYNINEYETGKTLMILIVCSTMDNKLDIIKELIKKELDIEEYDDNGYTLLMHAIKEQEYEIIDYLIEVMAEKNINKAENYYKNNF
jgi:ankyrin repeat protein